MAWTESVASKINSQLKLFAESFFRIAKRNGDEISLLRHASWAVARLDVNADVHGRWTAVISLFLTTGEKVKIEDLSDAKIEIEGLWQLRDSLSGEDRFHGLSMMVTENGQCKVQFDYNDPGKPGDLMKKAIVSSYNKNVASAFDKQIRLQHFLEEQSKPGNADSGWNYDAPRATLVVGPVTFEAPILGSFAEPENTWLWVWNNPQMNTTRENRMLMERVQSLDDRCPFLASEGQQDVLPVLGSELCPFAPDVIGMALSEELGYDAYFKVPYPFGCAILLIQDKRLRFTENNPALVMSSRFPQAIAAMPVPDHRSAFIAYAASYGLSVAVEEDRVTVGRTGQVDALIKARFDTANRMIELQSVTGAGR